ncbi:MutS domain V [Butyrivibrio sp. ob235]|uniref:MutS-related protein n=1 Tax=Butyrivibrio sp. ob235 TaxID=1761780 RepID=UPI0008AD41EF|nr:hypothetical protein [Butyrivibrio sp. ob235]SEK29955.1 MutS domain V [Butyrivibrio sp. ob235]
MTGAYILGIIASFIAAVFLIGLQNRKNEERSFKKKCADEYGAAPSSRIKRQRADVSGYYKSAEKKFSIDDITWNDLSMNEVYDRISYCETSSGEEYLYYLLRCPQTFDNGTFNKLENELAALSKDESERIHLKETLHCIGKSGKYSIYDYLPLIDKNSAGSNLVHVLMLILMVLSVLLMSFFNFTLGFLILIIAFAVNMVTYFKIKSALAPYLMTFSYVLRLMKGGEALALTESDIFKDDINKIKECVSKLKGFSRGSWILSKGYGATGSGNPFDIIMDYVRMLTHIDLIKFNSMYKKLKQEIPSVQKLTEIIGYIDSVISIAYFRASVSEYTVPELMENHGEYQIENGRHLLMDNPVPNSFAAKKGFLITGSNASGKSTFLKMCAINSIMAQTIHTCTCTSYKAPFYRVFTSMALRDDLTLGDSYYMVEIKSLKRILDSAAYDGDPVLCFIDEVLRGTNTIERIAASSKILEYFASHKERVLCFAATHDRELAEVLHDHFEVHHFEGDMENGDVTFDYKLKAGPATKRNAISLLKSIGYNDDIVCEAESMAKRFEEHGLWTL